MIKSHLHRQVTGKLRSQRARPSTSCWPCHPDPLWGSVSDSRTPRVAAWGPSFCLGSWKDRSVHRAWHFQAQGVR